MSPYTRYQGTALPAVPAVTAGAAGDEVDPGADPGADAGVVSRGDVMPTA